MSPSVASEKPLQVCGSMREFIDVLEAHRRLHRVRKRVDPTWEVAAMTRWIYQGFPMEKRFALLFENVVGSTIPIATGLIGTSREAYALALGTTPDGIHAAWLKALRHPIPPRVV